MLLIVLFASRVTSAHALPEIREGDVIFQTSQSSQSIAVQKATRSPYSHMGVILMHKGSLCVFEAISTVTCTPIEHWIARGKNKHYVLKRLRLSDKLSSPEALKRFRAAAQSFVGIPYDLTFEWNDSRMYCSELVWKIFNRALGITIGDLSKLRDFNLSSPAVQKKIKERYHGKPPLDEAVISPDAMFQSPMLVEVARG
jgi:hypothetical protein